MSGAGTQPAGLSPAGLGEPAQGATRGGKILGDAFTGATRSGRRIDPKTGRYTFDANGRLQGMTTGQQKVLLAVKTELGTAAVAEMGNRLRRIDRMTDSLQRECIDEVNRALARTINAGEVELLEVTPMRVGTAGAYLHIRFRDLSTGDEHTVTK